MNKSPMLMACLVSASFVPLAVPLTALAAPCLPAAGLVELDRRYEDALRSGDVAFLQTALADDYVWVHTLGSQIETKSALLARLARAASFKSRTTSDVQAHTQGDTVVLRGVSIVEQWNADGRTYRTNRYQFMRTWVDVDGQCRLLGVQTMNISGQR